MTSAVNYRARCTDSKSAAAPSSPIGRRSERSPSTFERRPFGEALSFPNLFAQIPDSQFHISETIVICLMVRQHSQKRATGSQCPTSAEVPDCYFLMPACYFMSHIPWSFPMW
jgi:hypothetical protein